MKHLNALFLSCTLLISNAAFAAVIDLTTAPNCDKSGITGDSGGANQCKGIFFGNDDPLNSYELDGQSFEFIGDSLGSEISLTANAANTSGTWAFSSLVDTTDFDDFLLTLNYSPDPSSTLPGSPAIWGAYIFDGAANASISGGWDTQFDFKTPLETLALTKMSLYGVKTAGSIPPPTGSVPEPSILALFGLGILGMTLLRRTRKS